MSISQAIRTAIEYENRVHGVYEEALRRTKSPIGKRVFDLLAREESRHVAYLEHKLATYDEEGVLSSGDLGTAIPAVRSIREHVATLHKTLETGDTDLEVEMLRKAAEVEMQTSGFYKRMVAELPEEGRAFFERFVEIEEGHLALVEAEIDAVTGLGYWFEMPEFDLEKG